MGGYQHFKSGVRYPRFRINWIPGSSYCSTLSGRNQTAPGPVREPISIFVDSLDTLKHALSRIHRKFCRSRKQPAEPSRPEIAAVSYIPMMAISLTVPL